jgi:anti-sigma factor RsiW
MMKGERQVSGLFCHEVLSLLTEYLEGLLPMKQREQLEEHVKGCNVCERFGGAFAGAIKQLKETLSIPEPLPAEVEQRLLLHLNEQIGE